MKILIPGGAGYIGSHTVVELVQAGYEPVIIDNFCNSNRKLVLNGLKNILKRAVRVYEGDCSDASFVRKIINKEKNVRGVIHFAAVKVVGDSLTDPLWYYQNNLMAMIAVIRAIQSCGITDFIFSSSACLYGDADAKPVTEITRIERPKSPYGNTKKLCEEILEDAVKGAKPLKTIALRYFNPVGAHPSGMIGEIPIGTPSNLVPFITQTAAGIQEQLTIFGNDYPTPDGTCIRDFIHVVDLARAHVHALSFLQKQQASSFYDVFNIGTGTGNSVLEAIHTFEKVTGKKLNYTIGGRREGDIEFSCAIIEKAKNRLDWKAEFTLADALRDAWRWQVYLEKENRK